MPAEEPELPDSQIEMPEHTDQSTGRGWPAAVIVSIAAVAVTALVGILGVINTRNSQFYEEEKRLDTVRRSLVSVLDELDCLDDRGPDQTSFQFEDGWEPKAAV